MKISDKCSQIEQFISSNSGKCIGFIPTMGALHSGHISLVERARKECDIVIVSIFVNPTQFNDQNDLNCYPRTLEADTQLLERAGVDMVFSPEVSEVYPQKDSRIFDFGELESVMEGATRPGHFNGVAQVVSRLFEIVKPQRAYFGEKDFQQLTIIRAMVKELGISVEIIAVPTVRGEDGLALSSRNALLDIEHREAAPEIYSIMKSATLEVNKIAPQEVEKMVIKKVNSNNLLEVIYFNIVDSDTLQNVTSWDGHRAIQGCIAVQAGNVRLIDNINFV